MCYFVILLMLFVKEINIGDMPPQIHLIVMKV